MRKVLIGLASVLVVCLVFACHNSPTTQKEQKQRPSEVEELVAFLKKFDPPRLEALKHLEKRNPKQFEKLLANSHAEMIRLKELKKNNPERFKQIMQERREKMKKEKARQRRLVKRPEDRERRERASIKPNEVIKFLKSFNPGRAEELQHLQKENPREFREVLQHASHEMMELKELKKHDPKRFKAICQRNQLEHKSHKLAEKYRHSDNKKDKERIKKELRKILPRIFDIQKKARMQDVQRMEKELRQLKEKMARRKKIRQQLIEERLKQLTGEKEEWEW